MLHNHLDGRAARSAFVASHAHPSSHRDEPIQTLQNYNLQLLLQNNVGPSERRGRARYPAPSTGSTAAAATAASVAELPDDASTFVAEDATGELSNSDAEENPLKHVKSWMMRVPMQENSQRWYKESNQERPAAQSAALSSTASVATGATLAPYIGGSEVSDAADGAATTADDDALHLAALGVYKTEQGGYAVDPAVIGAAAAASAASVVPVSSATLLLLQASSSFGPKVVHGVLGSSGLVDFLGRFVHYFGLFHLALMSLLCASYSNANTIFALYYIAVTGWLSYVGTSTANRFWRPLIMSLTGVRHAQVRAAASEPGARLPLRD